MIWIKTYFARDLTCAFLSYIYIFLYYIILYIYIRPA